MVAPTVAAVGLAFFSYGFPQAGTCPEITVPQIALVLLFTLVSHAAPTHDVWYLKRFSIYCKVTPCVLERLSVNKP